MKHQPTYLYQVKNSKNFYFRARKKIFLEKIHYISLPQGHFVASLKTSEYDEALWLSQFILKRIKEELTMDNMSIKSHQLLDSQVKHMSCINSLFNFPEEEFKLRLDTFLRERFKHWLFLGQKMVRIGAVEPDILQRLRTVDLEVLRDYYADEDETKKHPSVDQVLIDVFYTEAKNRGFKINPRLLEAKMISRLNAELIKLGKKHPKFSPDIEAETPEFDMHLDSEFTNLFSNLTAFRNFVRRAERKVNARKNKHLQLAICIEQFKKSKFAENGLSSEQQFTTSLAFLLSKFDDNKLVTEFTGEDVIFFKSAVQDIDSGRTKNGVMQKIFPATINKYLSNVSQFFEWLKDQPKYIRNNPFENTLVRVDEKKKNKRRKFEDSEIHKLKTYVPTSKKEARQIRNAAKWFVLIGLYSGMRLNEIGSLRVADVKSDEGIYYFDLTLLRGKSLNAPRLIPLHSKLIENGFMDYVKNMREQGETRLFPELAIDSKTAIRDGAGYQVGNWFNDTMLAKIGIDKKGEADNGIMIDFHCLRHTVSHRFKKHGADSYIVKQILGHDLKTDMTWGVYSSHEVTKLSALQRVIEMIDY